MKGCWVAAWLGVFAPTQALAQAAAGSEQPAALDTAAPAPVSDASAAAAAEPAEYAELVDAGIAEFKRGNWTEAQALFARAHALFPNARTLRGMGVSAFEAKQYVRAVQYLHEALAETRRPLDEAQQSEARSVIARAEPFIGRITLSVQPTDAGVTVDARAAVRDPAGALLVDPGLHELAVSAPDHAAVRRAVEVSPGDHLQVQITLEPTTAEPAPATALPPTRAPGQTADGDTTWMWIAGGASLVLAGTGVALWAIAQSGVSAVEDACPVGKCTGDQIDREIDRENLEALQVGYGVSFVLAGACAATAIVLFVADGDHGDETTLSATPTGLRLRGTF